MKKNLIITSFVFISSILAGAAMRTNFSVEVNVLLTGREKITYHVTNQRITVTEYSFNNEPKEVKVNRNLTPAETKKFTAFLSGFPLAQLKNQYVHSNIEGEIAFRYKINVNSIYKEIYVYYKNQKNLSELNNRINALLPVNLHLSLRGYQE